MNDQALYQKALDYHQKIPAGKISTKLTKPLNSPEDLSLAYSPGVAAPCYEIQRLPELSYIYTGKSNLVGVITNGSAVLGLGDIGADAAKPVMEGKAMLFKKYANIDVFDLEVNANTVEHFVNVVKALEPTFGGINLEDIKAPECFEIEERLRSSMSIPVFHDDQHGTAVVTCAAFLNAVELVGKSIKSVRVVMNGAGAAAIATAKLLLKMGVSREQIILCDTLGVIYKGRKNRMNAYKESFAIDTHKRTLEEALEGADVFVGVSVGNLLTKEMLKSMAKQPCIFAMANPTPEVDPEIVYAIHPDAIVVTGRSDYPNQVNNVLCFPYIFRGALDTHASTINDAMLLAAVKELAALAKEEVPASVQTFYYNEPNLHFSKKYIIPKPIDPRVCVRVSTAVAKAAIDTGVARNRLKIEEYKDILSRSLT